MPTASTSPAKAKPKAKARKPASRKPARAKATSASRATRTRSANQTERAVKEVRTATRDTAQVVGDYAERAVLIPVGAALIVRDRVVSTVSDTFATYSSSAKTQQQLRRFERRGVTARNRLEREVRKARVRVERGLRQRRRAFESTVNDLDDRRETLVKNGSELADRVQERLLSLV